MLLIISFSSLSAAEIQIIDLHSSKSANEENNTGKDEVILSENTEATTINLDEEDLLTEEVDINELNKNNDSAEINEETILENENIESNLVSNTNILSVPGYWEKSNKLDLDFFFNEVKLSHSEIINNNFIETLTNFSDIPQMYSQSEFDYLRINLLMKLGYKEKVQDFIKNINTYDSYVDFYNFLQLDYYLITNNLTEACSFKNSFQDDYNDKNNFILKVNIFCSFLENKIDEADLLNSLLIELNDKDQIFQNLYDNLKNKSEDTNLQFNNEIEKSSFSLYSAMIRIGNLPFDEKFLEFDPSNLCIPIVLSASTDIALRLKAAHIGYNLGLFDAESLSALYQTVDFTKDELTNWENTLKINTNNPEIIMALLFQNVRIQLLEITKLEALQIFWQFAENNNFEKLAYEVTKNLFISTKPSAELSDYALKLAKAHIANNNFEESEKWILFAKNYTTSSSEYNTEDILNIEFLNNLYQQEINDDFIILLEQNFEKIFLNNGSTNIQNELFKSILSLIIDNNELIDNLKIKKKVFDERLMPSKFLIDSFNSSVDNEKIGEMILIAMVSLNDKTWKTIHPEHLVILLNGFIESNQEKLFRNLLIEIFEDSKII